jgi:hypothetical protein
VTVVEVSELPGLEVLQRPLELGAGDAQLAVVLHAGPSPPDGKIVTADSRRVRTRPFVRGHTGLAATGRGISNQ